MSSNVQIFPYHQHFIIDTKGNDLWGTRVKISRGLINIPKKLTAIGVKRLMERAMWAQGLRNELQPGKKRHPFPTNHSLRKYFKTRCELAGMKPMNIENLMGHSTGISDSYYPSN